MASREYGGKRRDRGELNQARVDLENMAAGYAPMALRTLVSIARRGDSDAARASAAKAILDRALGKPKQAVEVSSDPDNPVNLGVQVYLPSNGRENHGNT